MSHAIDLDEHPCVEDFLAFLTYEQRVSYAFAADLFAGCDCSNDIDYKAGRLGAGNGFPEEMLERVVRIVELCFTDFRMVTIGNDVRLTDIAKFVSRLRHGEHVGEAAIDPAYEALSAVDFDVDEWRKRAGLPDESEAGFTEWRQVRWPRR